MTTLTPSKAYQLARLRKHAPEIADAFERGEYRSLRAAMIAAGMIKLPEQPTPLDAAKRAFLALNEDERGLFRVWFAAAIDTAEDSACVSGPASLTSSDGSATASTTPPTPACDAPGA